MRLILTGALVLVGCGGTPGVPNCDPDRTITCECSGGVVGTKTCQDSKRWGTCNCSEDGSIVDTVGPDAGFDTDPPDAESSGGIVEGDINFVFVTTNSYEAGSIGGLTQADTICQNEADTASLDGTYIAWMSSTTEDAKTRLENTGAQGWARPDRRPFANTVTDMVAGRVLYPPRLDATGADLERQGYLLTGTNPDGTGHPERVCNDWTSTTGDVGSAYADATGTSWGGAGAYSTCMATGHLLCFGTDKTVELPTVAAATGRKAFVTSAALPLTTGAGRAGADALCNVEATTASLEGDFAALVATTDRSAASVFSTSGSTWVRVDGVRVFEMAGDLSKADASEILLVAPLNVTAGGTYLTNSFVWTGAATTTVPATAGENCADWTASDFDTSGRLGQSVRTLAYYFDSLWGAFMPSLPRCSGSYPIYCLER